MADRPADELPQTASRGSPEHRKRHQRHVTLQPACPARTPRDTQLALDLLFTSFASHIRFGRKKVNHHWRREGEVKR